MVDKKESKNNKAESNNIPAHIGMESVLGAVCLLTTKSPSHRYLFSSEYEWMIIPPIAAKQFSLFRNDKKEPIAFVSWARVNDEIEKRLLDGALKLRSQDWTSGDKLYIIDIISPFIPIPEILKELNQGQFKDKGDKIKILKANKEKGGMQSVLLQDAVKEMKNKKRK